MHNIITSKVRLYSFFKGKRTCNRYLNCFSLNENNKEQKQRQIYVTSEIRSIMSEPMTKEIVFIKLIMQLSYKSHVPKELIYKSSYQ